MEGTDWLLVAGSYAGCALAAIVGAIGVQVRMRRGWPPVREPRPYELAYLSGGARHAIAAVLAALLTEGSIRSNGDRRMRAQDPPKVARSPLDLAVYDAIEREEATRTATLAAHPDVRLAVGDLRVRLAAAGLTITEAAERRLNLVRKVFIGLGVVGFALIAVILNDDGPYSSQAGGLIFGSGMLLLVTSPLTRPGRDDTTRAGRAAVRDVRARTQHLDPRMSPAWRTYGPAGAALGVALYGTAALLSIDRDFTRTVRLGRYIRLSGRTVTPEARTRLYVLRRVTGAVRRGTRGDDEGACGSGCGSCGGGGGSSCGGGGGGGCGGGGGGGD